MNYPEVKVLPGVKKVLEGIKGRTFQNIYFVACGGSSALMQPSQFLVDTMAEHLAAQSLNSNEFIYRNQPALGRKSVVILCSQEGKTPETVAAAAYAKKKGATVITIAMEENTPLEQEGEFYVRYGYYGTADAIDTSYGVMYLLTAGILDQQEGLAVFEKMTANLLKLTAVINKAKEQYRPQAEVFAKSCKDERVIYSLASGLMLSRFTQVSSFMDRLKLSRKTARWFF